MNVHAEFSSVLMHFPPYSIQGFAQDAIALLDHLGIARTHVYGHSMVGMISQQLAISHPERVGDVPLAGTAPGNPIQNTQGHAVSRTAEVEALMTHLPTDPEQALKAILLTIYSLAHLEAHPELVQAELQALPVPEYAVRLHIQAVKGHDAWDLLPTIQAPTLVIHGSDHRRVPTANAYLLAGRIPSAELSIIQGGLF